MIEASLQVVQTFQSFKSSKPFGETDHHPQGITAPTLIQLQASFKLKWHVAGIERHLAESYKLAA
jgi:hypothetical protein